MLVRAELDRGDGGLRLRANGRSAVIAQVGPACQSCYTAIVRSPAECARCGTSQPLIARNDTAAGICGPCTGLDVDYTCRECGRGGNPYGNGRCAFCVLADRMNTVLAGAEHHFPQLQLLVEAFSHVRLPFTAIQWIRESSNAKLLAQLACDGRPISHELLDDPSPDDGETRRRCANSLWHRIFAPANKAKCRLR